jgi:hypothetical protein
MLGYVVRVAKRTYTVVMQAVPPVLLLHLDAHLILVASRVKPRREILREAKLVDVVGEKTGRDDRVSIHITDQTTLILQLARHQVQLDLHSRHLRHRVLRRGG